jgi:hypothetical protein
VQWRDHHQRRQEEAVEADGNDADVEEAAGERNNDATIISGARRRQLRPTETTMPTTWRQQASAMT